MPDAMLIEALSFEDAKVDHENFVIKGVKLSGRFSRNKSQGRRRVYSDEAIKQSTAVFEGCPVTVRGGHDRANRDYDCQNGQLRNGRFENVGTDAAASRFDWHLNSADPLTAKIMEDAEKFPQNVPLSQEVMEWTERLNDEGDVLIETITSDPMKIGVAVVYRGGINNSLFESIEDKDMEIKTKEELQARFPSLCEELVECGCSAQKSTTEELQKKLEDAIAEREAALAEITKLKGQLEGYEAVEQKQKQTAEITEAAQEIVAEDYVVSEELMEDLLGLFEGDAYKRVLTEISKHYSPAGGDDETDADGKPTSKSGARSREAGQPARRKMGIHNLRS